ncbi:alpha-tocopherol transfer protein-like [Macrosteles quadrilineatus]|uniref:alpha-tocopherol transfer protein-like n=2 Tax=Macrosteles quadrilineatus TaxID=74068 RepID=UPI0023E0B42F|nr:alpha-tocopherol transfer protein-like [Macrosteles quadrilineatus]
MVGLEAQYRTSLQSELKRYPNICVEDIAAVQEWIATQPHLPQIYDVQIAHFLHASYYDVEIAKNAIEHYYTYKASMTEFFTDWDPLSTRLAGYVSKVLYAAFLPKQSPESCQMILLRLRDPSLDLYSFNLSVKWLLMSVTAQLLSEGQQSEYKIIYDADSYTMSHVMRNPLSAVRHYLDFGQKASAIRVVEIHFINSSSVVKKLISLVKPFMNKHIMKMLHFHTSSDAFFKSLPKDQTPSDYGGTAPSLDVLTAENTKRVEEMREALLAHNQQKVDESKRIGKKKKSKVEEDFKKLEID